MIAHCLYFWLRNSQLLCVYANNSVQASLFFGIGALFLFHFNPKISIAFDVPSLLLVCMYINNNNNCNLFYTFG